MNDLLRQGSVLLVLVGIYAGIFVVVQMLTWRKRRSEAKRRSPLTSDLLRPPGHSLQERLDILKDDIVIWLFQLIFGPLVIYAIYLTQSHVIGIPDTATRIVLSAGTAFAFLCFGGWKLFRLAREKERVSIGLDAERAAAQELNQLMREGARVFHDVPAEGFNVDHVVVSPAGVYAVETKGRAKPISGDGRRDARVEFDGAALKFPRWTETKPIAQAERQAKWLQRWLSSAVGAAVEVVPVLILPGWFIERTGRGRVLVFNGKNPDFLLRRNGVVIDESLQLRIAHQLEQRCRTVERALGPKRDEVRAA